MSEFVEVKTAELVGLALDWAAALADRGADRMPSGAQFKVWGDYRPSTNWSHGGYLLDKYDVGIEPGAPDGLRYAYVPGRDLDGSFGETALIALCRAIVAAKLGDMVQVPAELVGVK